MTITDNDVAINQEYTISSQAQLSSAYGGFSKDGYSISSWNSKSDGSGIAYTLEQILQVEEVSGDIEFWAQWKKE